MAIRPVNRAIAGPVAVGITGGGEPPTPAAPVISLTSISGNDRVTDTLSSSVVFSAGYPAPSVTYQWQRGGVDISGATSDTYTLVAADAGANITLDVEATNSEGSDTDTSNTIAAAALAVPVITGVPTISGTNEVGNELTATAASPVTGNPPPTQTWQWERDGTPIAGATSSTYTLVSADANTDITVVQTETNTQGADTAESAATSILAAPSITSTPTTAGTETVGSVLTATPGSVTGTPTPTRTHQWQRSANGTTGWADISGATSVTYTLVEADENQYIRYEQTETNSQGTDTDESAASGQISAAASSPLLTDLIAYWDLDESSGNRADSASTYTLTDVNTVGNGLGVDGVSTAAQFVLAASESLEATGDAALRGDAAAFSMALWVRPDSVTANQALVSCLDTSPNYEGFQLRINSSGSTVRLLIGEGGGANFKLVSSSGALSAATWHFVYAEWDGSNIGVSVDNSSLSTTAATTYDDGTAKFTLAANSVAAALPYGGRMQSVGRWNRTLTAAERTWLYNSGTAARTYTDVEGYSP